MKTRTIRKLYPCSDLNELEQELVFGRNSYYSLVISVIRTGVPEPTPEQILLPENQYLLYDKEYSEQNLIGWDNFLTGKI